MESGQMYYLNDPKKSLSETITFLIDLHKIKDIKYVLVHPASLQKEILINKVKITPKRGVLPNHYWFICNNTTQNMPEYANFRKIT